MSVFLAPHLLFSVSSPAVPFCFASPRKRTDIRLDVFFEHHRLFFDLNIPRFRSRLTFHDRRRPSLALLNAMVGPMSFC